MSDDIDTIRVMPNPPSPPTGGDEVSAKSQPRRTKQSFYFTVVLYPDEDPKHTMLAEYIKSHYECAWIQHTKMYDTDPKSHVHMLFRLQSRSTIRGVNRFFQIDHCELVENLQSMLQYFVHDTPACIMDYDNGNGDLSKRPYSVDDLHAPDKWRSLIRQKSRFVQLSTLLEDAQQGLTVWESIASRDENEREAYGEFVLSHPTVVHMVGQQLSEQMRRSRYIASSGYHVIDSNGDDVTFWNPYIKPNVLGDFVGDKK